MCYTIVKGIIEESISKCGPAQPIPSTSEGQVRLCGSGTPETTTETKKRKRREGNIEKCHTQTNQKRSRVEKVVDNSRKVEDWWSRKTENDAKVGNEILKFKSNKQKRSKNVLTNSKAGKTKNEQKMKITDFFEVKMPIDQSKATPGNLFELSGGVNKDKPIIGGSGRGGAVVGADQGVGEIIMRIKNAPVEDKTSYHMKSEGGG